MRKAIGLHLPNIDEVKRAERDLIRLSKANALKALIPQNSPRLLRELRDETGITKYCLRVWYHGNPPPPEEFAEQAKAHVGASLEVLDGCEIIVQLANEPNHVDAVDGFGTHAVGDFCYWYGQVLHLVRNEGWDIVFPGLAQNHPNHGAWLERCAFWMDASKLTGAHGYFQGEYQHAGWWGRYPEKVAEVTKNDVVVLEWNDTSFQNPSECDPSQRSRRAYEWLRWMICHPRIVGSYFFMLGAGSGWNDFALDRAIAEAMASAQDDACNPGCCC